MTPDLRDLRNVASLATAAQASWIAESLVRGCRGVKCQCHGLDTCLSCDPNYMCTGQAEFLTVYEWVYTEATSEAVGKAITGWPNEAGSHVPVGDTNTRQEAQSTTNQQPGSWSTTVPNAAIHFRIIMQPSRP